MSRQAAINPDATLATGEAGLIAVDEHTSIGCWVNDLSGTEIEITVLDTSCVPDVFMLTSPARELLKVCRTLWRTDEVIGARYR